MKKLWVVIKNELFRYFISSVAYIYLISFLILNGVATFYFGHLFERGQASLFYMFCFQPWLYLLFLPGISMRLWAEEFKSKTIVQMMTMPISLPSLVLGKFLASFIFCAIALLLTFPFVITVNVLGQPDNAVIAVSYFASLILAAAMLSVSETMSALTKNQVIALVLAVIANLVFFFSGLEFILSFFRIFLPDFMIDTIASFSFLTHFNTMISGLIEWRSVLFFLSVIVLFNFTTMLIISFKTAGTSLWLKSTKKAYYVFAWIMLVVCFIGFNLLANNLTRTAKIDFTEEKFYDLNQNTVDLLQNLKEPVTAKLYFSKILERRNPTYRQMFDHVRMLLEEYKEASNGRFDYRVYHPESLDNVEDRAISDGLQPIALIDINQNALFGLSVVDALDHKAVIGYLSFDRLNFLEQDLTSLIYTLSNKKKTLGIISSLPINGEGGSDNMILEPWEITRKLGEFYNLKFIKTDEDFDEKIDVLLMIHPKNLDEKLVEKVKEYSKNFGKILLLLDGATEASRLYMSTSSPYEPSDLGGLDQFWGFRFYNEYVVADLENSITVDATTSQKTNPAYTQDVIQFRLKKDNFNPLHLVTKNLSSLLMSSASVIMPNEEANISFIPLLQASSNSALMPIKVVYDGLNPRQVLSYFEKDENAKFLSAYIHGKDSDNQFDLIVVGDTDFIYNNFWASPVMLADETYFVPLFNNADFVLNAVDFLSNNSALLKLRGKTFQNRAFQNLENLRKNNVFEYKVKEEDIFKKIDQTKKDLQEIWNKRNFEERETFTADELALISSMKKNLIKFRKELSQIKMMTTKSIDQIALKVKLINIFGVPFVLLLILLIASLVKRRAIKNTSGSWRFDKQLLKLTLFCLMVLLFGIASVYVGHLSEIESYENKPLFKNLVKEINNVQKIMIKTHDVTLTFKKESGEWVLVEYPDFPVYQARVRSFLSALIEATFYEKKSDKAEHLHQFGLLPVEAEGSTNTRIELLGENDQMIDSLEVGDYHIELGRGGSGAYVKFDGKFQVWLAEVEFVDLSPDWHAWTYSHLWDLRFGRLISVDGVTNPDILSVYMKIFLNAPLASSKETIKLSNKLESLNILSEDEGDIVLHFYQTGNQYYVQYEVKNSQNKDLKIFDKAAKKHYFEIEKETWEKIKNVRDLVKNKG